MLAVRLGVQQAGPDRAGYHSCLRRNSRMPQPPMHGHPPHWLVNCYTQHAHPALHQPHCCTDTPPSSTCVNTHDMARLKLPICHWPETASKLLQICPGWAEMSTIVQHNTNHMQLCCSLLGSPVAWPSHVHMHCACTEYCMPSASNMPQGQYTPQFRAPCHNTAWYQHKPAQSRPIPYGSFMQKDGMLSKA